MAGSSVKKRKRLRAGHKKNNIVAQGRRKNICVLKLPTHVEFRQLPQGQWLGNWFKHSGAFVDRYKRVYRHISAEQALSIADQTRHGPAETDTFPALEYT